MSTFDGQLFDSVAQFRSPILDRTMRPLSAAADRSVLWMVIAAGLAAREGGARRAAVRGLASVAATSVIVNQGLKAAYPRRRPLAGAVPTVRVRPQPTSASFPSGHSASAAAFAVGVGIESPRAGLALVGLAGAVGFSRIATGAHYPSDVVAGFGVGAAIALIGARLVPPMRDTRDVADPTVEQLTPDSSGAGLVVVVNPASGDGTGTRVIDALVTALPRAEIVQLQPDSDIEAIATEAVQRAQIVGVAGGDGTVATLAARAISAGKPLAVFPAGTFNHFARDIGAVGVESAIDLLRAGKVAHVDVVWLNNQRLLLNTASIGAYPDFVRLRSRYQKYRVTRTVATIRAMLRVLRRSVPVQARISGQPASVSFFFLGSSRYGTTGFFPRRRSRLDDGLLDVRYLDARHRYATARLLAWWLGGRSTRSRIYRELQAPTVVIESEVPFRVAHDGEVGELYQTARFTVGYRQLRVFGTSTVGGKLPGS